MAMFWSEADEKATFVVPDNVVDLVFRVQCRKIPIDHAWQLSREILTTLPWLEQEASGGIHLVHGAESGNGWQRPDDDEYLMLSRRTRFSLRLPKHRVEDARVLSGRSFSIDDCDIVIGDANVKHLSDSAILFSRHVVMDRQEMTEQDFLGRCHEQLHALGIQTRKMMCGRAHRFSLPDGSLYARSLMLANLDVEDSVQLQETGLGPHRMLGMGLFIPHRGIDAVYKKPDE